ncbi:MAG: putative quinol monooxygenase [Pseudonocardia sp.]
MSSVDGPVVVVAHYRVRPGAADEVAAALREYTGLVRAEPGCLGFTAHRDRADPEAFALYESYRSQADLDAHVASEHYARIARDRIRPLLAERTVAFYDVLDG